MLTTALNTLILIRLLGLRLVQEPGWDGFGPLLIVLAVVGLLIGLLSWVSQSAPQTPKHVAPAGYLRHARQNELMPR